MKKYKRLFESREFKIIKFKIENDEKSFKVRIEKYDKNNFSVLNDSGKVIFNFYRKLKVMKSYHRRERGIGLSPEKNITTETQLNSWIKTKRPIKNSENRLEAEASKSEKLEFLSKVSEVYQEKEGEPFAVFKI